MWENVIRVMMCGGSDTPLLGTPIPLTGTDIDAEVARIYGLQDPIAVPITRFVRPVPCVCDAGTMPSDIVTDTNGAKSPDSGRAGTLDETSPYMVKNTTDLKNFVYKERKYRVSSSS
jgi:hypothetical protein